MDNQKYVLLIWEIIPEETEFYLIPETVAQEYQHWLLEAHGNFINGIGDIGQKGLDFLNTVLSPEDGKAAEGMEKMLSLWRRYKQDAGIPIIGRHIVAVYLSGFIL